MIKANELTEGEYRSHLFFRSMPNKNALGEGGVEPAKDSGFSIKLTPVFGISIPMIIRVGETSVKSIFSDAQFALEKETQPILDIVLNRSGNISSYGDITVNYIGANNKVIPVCYMKGLAVYTPNTKRKLHLPLQKKDGVDYKSGKLQVLFTDQAQKSTTLCEQTISL